MAGEVVGEVCLSELRCVSLGTKQPSMLRWRQAKWKNMWGQYLKQKTEELHLMTPRGMTPRRPRAGQTPRGAPRFESHIDELQQSSKFFKTVMEDVERYREQIEAVAAEVLYFQGDNMAQNKELVLRTEALLGKLADENLVLKNFSWPEDKLTSMREAMKRDAVLQKVHGQQERMAGVMDALRRDEQGNAGEGSVLDDHPNYVLDGQQGLALQDPREVDAWLLTNVQQFGQACSAVDHLKRQLEEMRPRYYKHGIPFDFNLIARVELGCLLFAKAHMLVVLRFLQKDPSSPLARAWLKRAFEFAFKVQQFTNTSDDETTELLEQVFERLEHTHEATMQELKCPSPRKQRGRPVVAPLSVIAEEE
eukprot:TRINITY_DN6956_c0_g1_i6.p1 TRINITY_DN6956_c0_g1~~TRINITY_DN6956_c0_g1_i6.p1  ORF type:complete len:364 (-),score=97.13 TRINITY_DN6956_c0_g1_i6:195-1286(-)